ncbi:MAG: hypothetical protein WA741_24515, partial [Candidatus Sulfotelmatobacter sp.]
GIFGASGVTAGLFGGKAPKIFASRTGTTSRTAASAQPVREGEIVYAAEVAVSGIVGNAF